MVGLQKETPYEGGSFVLQIKFESGYPMKAPDVSAWQRAIRIDFLVAGEVCDADLPPER